MKTKIVYVVASLGDDVFMEQAFVSAWSARHYNSSCQIEMVCDQDTEKTLSEGVRKEYKSLFNKIIKVNLDDEYSMVERSRMMKTNLRELIEGDFIYFDTDTVICGDLSYIDQYDLDIGLVYDNNCSFDKYIIRPNVINKMQKIFGCDVSKETEYFNSGVVYCKDSLLAHEFYAKWHENWLFSRSVFKEFKDQPPLMKANIDMGHIVTELTGRLNCQVVASIQYLHEAEVLHFYNNFLGKSTSIHPFMDVEFYKQVKKEGLTDDITMMILRCKNLFTSPSMPVPLEGAQLWRENLSSSIDKRIKVSNFYHLLYSLWYRIPMFMRVMDIIIGVPIRALRWVKNIF
ncbi:MAG: hypothetical protein Q4E60_10975 [Bacteroidales bacterium]|nr:hypothetical protein [Bacteroidales bacterium]